MGLGSDLEARLLEHTTFGLFLLCHLHFIFLIYNIYDYIYMCTYIYISLYMHHISVDIHSVAFRPCSCAIFFLLQISECLQVYKVLNSLWYLYYVHTFS